MLRNGHTRTNSLKSNITFDIWVKTHTTKNNIKTMNLYKLFFTKTPYSKTQYEIVRANSCIEAMSILATNYDGCEVLQLDYLDENEDTVL